MCLGMWCTVILHHPFVGHIWYAGLKKKTDETTDRLSVCLPAGVLAVCVHKWHVQWIAKKQNKKETPFVYLFFGFELHYGWMMMTMMMIVPMSCQCQIVFGGETKLISLGTTAKDYQCLRRVNCHVLLWIVLLLCFVPQCKYNSQ